MNLKIIYERADGHIESRQEVEFQSIKFLGEGSLLTVGIETNGETAGLSFSFKISEEKLTELCVAFEKAGKPLILSTKEIENINKAYAQPPKPVEIREVQGMAVVIS